MASPPFLTVPLLRLLTLCTSLLLLLAAPASAAAAAAMSSASSPPPSPMRVAVFGGSGFVGKRFCRALVRSGCRVASVSRSGRPEPLPSERWDLEGDDNNASGGIGGGDAATAAPPPSWMDRVEWLAADLSATDAAAAADDDGDDSSGNDERQRGGRSGPPSLPALLGPIDAAASCVGNVRSSPDWDGFRGLHWDDGAMQKENGDVNESIAAAATWNPRGDTRRRLVTATGTTILAGLSASTPLPSMAESIPSTKLSEVTDPQTYSALAYTPPNRSSSEKLPLIVVLHGAGKNEGTARDLANLSGEHAGLMPSLLATGAAPSELADNFAVVAPYAAGKRSFYEEPRMKLLQFVGWVCSDAGREAGCPDVDPRRIFLFGFSDGATVGVELLTSGRFRGGVIAAYGFTGELPALALERLRGVPIWVFHSADDVIFPVKCSDKLVGALRRVNVQDNVRYTRYNHDQEGFTGAVRGHSTGITASRQPDIYKWMLSI